MYTYRGYFLFSERSIREDRDFIDLINGTIVIPRNDSAVKKHSKSYQLVHDKEKAMQVLEEFQNHFGKFEYSTKIRLP